ncbi:hypothetical protein ACVCAH_35120 [Micromonospora sp. LZ34]
MKDIDSGFFKFCASYNDPRPVLPPARDPVVKKFVHLNQFPYAQVERSKWAMVGVADRDAIINVVVDVLRRPWFTGPTPTRIPGQPGWLYNVVITARDRRHFDYSQFLKDTEHLQSSVVHVCLDSLAASVRVTIPAVLGTRKISTTIQRFLDWAPNALRPGRSGEDKANDIQRLAEEWPEYVLGPDNPLSFLAPDMKCSFFTL